MLKQAVLQPSLLLFPRHPTLLTSSVVAFSQQRQWRRQRRKNNTNNINKVRCAAAANESWLSGQPTIVAESRRQATVKAEATVLLTVREVFAQMETMLELHDVNGLLGPILHLELVSADLDQTGSEKKTVAAFAKKAKIGIGSITYEATFSVPENFGKIGAVVVQNEHHNELFLKDIVLTIHGDYSAPLLFDCKSWVHSKFDNSQDRVFFTTNKSYLPSETPAGLVRLRQRELEILRGDGTGERKKFERIYDYTTSTMTWETRTETPGWLGQSSVAPRSSPTRAGAAPASRQLAQRSATVYVPRDESFSEVKQLTFRAKTLQSVLHGLLPSVEAALVDSRSFPYFTAIDELFNEGLTLSTLIFSAIVPRLVKAIVGGISSSSNCLN